MKRNQSSLTAEGIAIVRAIESQRPEGERVCFDPYARQLVNPFLFSMVNFFEKLGYGERKGPGVLGFIAARERHIDAYLERMLDEGFDQLVILGAGLDARAYRFERLKISMHTFEVDHPASQRAKRKKVTRVFGALPAHVRYVPVDFTSDSLEEKLLAAGYNPALKTFFIWQGVTPYLDLPAVDATLGFIVRRSAPRSAVVFDYMYTSLLDGTIKRGEVEKMNTDRVLKAETLRFGIPEGQITAFLQARGFEDVEDAGSETLKALYFHGAAAKRTVAYGYAIAAARVKGRG